MSVRARVGALLRPSVVAGLVAAGLVVAVAVAGAVGPTHEATDGSGSGGAARPSATTAPLTDVSLVCPAVPAQSSVSSAMVTAAAPAGPGTITLTPLGAPSTAKPLATASAGTAPADSQVLRWFTTAKVKGPLVVRAQGTTAQGLTAQAVIRTVAGRGRALSSMPCTRATAESWLVGGSAVSGRRDVLFLSNPEAAAAIADVTVWGSKGPSRPPQAQGVTIPAGRQVTLALDALVPGEGNPVVQVRTRSGRVAVGLVDTATNGFVAQGVDFVPPSALPARTQVVVGIPGDPDVHRVLTLLAPGDSDANVKIRLSTPQGVLTPPGIDENGVLISSGQTKAVDLTKLADGPYAVLVDSDQPVVAGVRAVRGGAHLLPDFSFAGSTPPMVGTSVVMPVAARNKVTASSLQLTAPSEADVVARVTPLDPNGQPLAPVTVTVAAGRTAVVPVGLDSKGYTAVRVETTGEEPLVVGWVLTVAYPHGPFVAGGGVLQTPLVTVLPPVLPDPSAGLPGTTAR